MCADICHPYEWGYTYGPPMAVAPLPNVRRVLDYAVTEIPPEKIYLGIPNYGYDWPLPFRQGETKARSISNQYAVEMAVAYRAAISYDETAQSPWFNYTRDGRAHVVWFEDAVRQTPPHPGVRPPRRGLLESHAPLPPGLDPAQRTLRCGGRLI